MLVIILDVCLFLFFCFYPGGPPTRFLLDFQPSVVVVCEQSFTGLVKMPDLIDVLDLVPELDGFRQFRAAPCASQDALLVGVDAFSCSFPGAFGHFVLHTLCTEGKGEFSLMAVRQYGMVEVTWRQDLALDQAKVLMDVRVTRVGDETRMSFGVDTGFVDPRVQGGDIDVMDLLSGGDMVVQLDSIGTTSTESVAWNEGFCEDQVSQKGTDVRGGVFETGPITFPDLDDIVPLLSKVLDPLLGGLVDILHGSIIVV